MSFAADIGCPFYLLCRNGIPGSLLPNFWRQFVAAYNAEFGKRERWIPWIRASLDFRRIGVYAINIRRQQQGQDSHDFPLMDQMRNDMFEGKPAVDFDFALR